MTTPDAPTPDLRALADDYASRCGWTAGDGYQAVYPKDLALAFLTFHKEAAALRVERDEVQPVASEAEVHIVNLEQCSLFVDSDPIKRAMTDAAAFLRRAHPPATSPGAAGEIERLKGVLRSVVEKARDLEKPDGDAGPIIGEMVSIALGGLK